MLHATLLALETGHGIDEHQSESLATLENSLSFSMSSLPLSVSLQGGHQRAQ